MEHINEIMMGVFVLLIAAHFGLHFYLKAVKKRQDKQRAQKKKDAAETAAQENEDDQAKN
ncbi:hypothetical protein [Hydrogenovibrio kuenenii]|uniref:hypothetical protein n=1 Tax=Hydrogenovibrio kuenenii TaxID=63658 RepID=UPI000464A724|nr:hypothetical protein [Hydrogenovibrio kuenenii]